MIEVWEGARQKPSQALLAAGNGGIGSSHGEAFAKRKGVVIAWWGWLKWVLCVCRFVCGWMRMCECMCVRVCAWGGGGV